MKYDWPRVHKVEENLMIDINDLVYEHVMEHFGIEDIEDLSEEQIDEVETFRLQLSEYSVLQGGYSNLIGLWESQ